MNRAATRDDDMNMFSKVMVAMTGHYINSATRAEDIGGLSKIGLSICFAAALAALQFGVAGWFLASGIDADARIAVSMVTAIVGACIVLIIDRNFIYAADTSAQSKGYFSHLYLAIRILLILAVSSLSSQFTLPLLLKSELEIHVQDLRDERYDIAKDRYNNKYELPEKVRSERDLTQQITKIKASLFNLPQELVHQKLASEQCMREYKKKVNASIGPDIDDEEVANLYARDKMQCEQLELAYKESYKLYVTPRQAELAVSEGTHKHLELDVGQAQSAFKSELLKADQNNSQYLNTSSADVLWSLIRHNPGARMKYLMITLVQLVLELMPLLLKSLLGRSPLGVGIAIRTQDMYEKLESSEHHRALAQTNRLSEHQLALFQNKEAGLSSKITLQHLANKLGALKAESRSPLFGFSLDRTHLNASKVAQHDLGDPLIKDSMVGPKPITDLEGRKHQGGSATLPSGLYAIT